MKNRIVNNTGATLPMAQEALIDLVDQYIQDALDTESSVVLNNPDAKKRLEDFILYTTFVRDINLLDILHLKTTITEEAQS